MASERGEGGAMADGCALLQRTVGGEECKMGRASAFGQARGGFKARLRRQDAHGAWPARAGVQRRVADTRHLFSEPVGHGGTEGFLKNAIQC